MTEEAIQARRDYKRRWAREHPEKTKEYQRRYWQKKGQKAAAAREPAPAQLEQAPTQGKQ